MGTRPATIDHIQITNLGRETLLYPVEWTEEWPVISKGIPSLEVDLTDFPNHSQALSNPQNLSKFTDYFVSEQLDPEWTTLRNQLGSRLLIENQQLILKGSNLTLKDLSNPSFLAVRQTEHEQTFVVTINPKNSQLNQGSLGIAVIINSDHYAALLLSKEEHRIVVRKHIQILDLEWDEIIGELSALPETLTLHHTTCEKVFTAQTQTETIQYSISAQHFSNEAIAALNTGDMQGLYVLGDAKLVVKSVKRK